MKWHEVMWSTVYSVTRIYSLYGMSPPSPEARAKLAAKCEEAKKRMGSGYRLAKPINGSNPNATRVDTEE